MSRSSTPTLPAYIREQQEQRERQMQTSFPAKVIEYDGDTGTVTLEPQFYEVWRDTDGSRRREEIENKEDAYIANVPIAFPQASGFRITFPVAADDWGLVTCTKYSLDLWRQQGDVNDPGDLRRFTMSGAVFHPVNLQPDASNIVHDGDGDDCIVLSQGGDVDWLCLYTEVKQNLDDIKDAFANHTHVYNECSGGDVGVVAPGSTETSTDYGYTVTDPKNAKVKVE